MTQRLIILLANTDPDRPAEVGPPLYQAAVAAALDAEVRVICTARATRLMRKGEAERLEIKPGSGHTVLDFIRMAKDGGVRFYVCSASLDLLDMTEADLIPECDGLIGTTQYMADFLSGACRMLSY